MIKYLTILTVLLIGCLSKSVDKTDCSREVTIEDTTSIELEKVDENERLFLDSLYNRESDNYFSKLEEIPNRETNAYRIIIKSKNGLWEKNNVIDTRPQMSRIIFCNDLFTVISFPCGGPCHSEVFVFTSKSRPNEQYDFVEFVKNKPTIITHFRNEEFENLIVHNLTNNKELKIDVSKNEFLRLDFIDSIILNKNVLKIHYTSLNDEQKIKTTNIESIL